MSTTKGSTSFNPDLDWSQLKETILMLNLSVAQIDRTLHDGNASISTLSNSFTALATNISDIQSSIKQLNSEEDDCVKVKTIIHGSTITALDKVQSAIIAFQFYDKLTQRIEHVSQSLASLTTLISDPSTLYSPIEWKSLQESIRSKYTMDEERIMFDRVISGMPIEQAIIEFNNDMANADHSEEDEIELF